MLKLGKGTGQARQRREAPPQSLLVVCDLNNEGDIEGVLEPFREHEGYQVPKMQSLRRWALQSMRPFLFAEEARALVHPMSSHHLQRWHQPPADAEVSTAKALTRPV